MNQKEYKRRMAYEALIMLLLLALLLFITRLWPILLLVILGIFIATLRPECSADTACAAAAV